MLRSPDIAISRKTTTKKTDTEDSEMCSRFAVGCGDLRSMPEGRPTNSRATIRTSKATMSLGERSTAFPKQPQVGSPSQVIRAETIASTEKIPMAQRHIFSVGRPRRSQRPTSNSISAANHCHPSPARASKREVSGKSDCESFATAARTKSPPIGNRSHWNFSGQLREVGAWIPDAQTTVGMRCLVSGVWCLVPGVWCLVSSQRGASSNLSKPSGSRSAIRQPGKRWHEGGERDRSTFPKLLQGTFSIFIFSGATRPL